MESKMNIEDEWLEIVGFPNYLINIDTLVVKNIVDDKILRVGKSNQVFIRNDGGQYRTKLPRLLFCAINKINPRVVHSDIVVVIENDKPVVYGRNEYLYKKRVECQKIRKTDINPLQTYREGRDFVDKVIVSFETGQMNDVFDEIYRYKNDIIYYLLGQELVYTKNNAEEIASCSLETTMEHIMSGKVVFKPLGHLLKVARILAFEMSNGRQKHKEFLKNLTI